MKVGGTLPRLALCSSIALCYPGSSELRWPAQQPRVSCHRIEGKERRGFEGEGWRHSASPGTLIPSALAALFGLEGSKA